jgi:hypothetical protein
MKVSELYHVGVGVGGDECSRIFIFFDCCAGWITLSGKIP